MRLLLLELLIVGGGAGLVGAVLGNLASLGIGALLGGQNVFGVTVPSDAAWPDWRWTLLMLLAPPITVTLGGLFPAWRVARLQTGSRSPEPGMTTRYAGLCSPGSHSRRQLWRAVRATT
jgi:ABC-type antimicrobial peptide transport system permease subunit